MVCCSSAVTLQSCGLVQAKDAQVFGERLVHLAAVRLCVFVVVVVIVVVVAAFAVAFALLEAPEQGGGGAADGGFRAATEAAGDGQDKRHFGGRASGLG